jgi:gliding motility-associated-like protein
MHYSYKYLMNCKSVSLALVFLLFVTTISHAQKNLNNSVWRFGLSAEVRFDTLSNEPAVSNNTGTRANYNSEGCAIANDPKTGAILFYTDGTTIYNRNNTVMTNGNAIGGNSANTTAQSALIVPIPDCKNTRFYVFTNDASHNGSPTTPGNLRYSIVDMTLNGGLGDVTVKGQLIRNDIDEGMCIAYHQATNKYWLFTKVDKINTFVVIKISDDASEFTANTRTFNLPPPASSGVTNLSNTFTMHFSPASNKVALAMWAPAATVATVDFNPLTGIASNCQIVDNNALNAIADRTTSPIYDVAWSPDGSKLYAGTLGAAVVYQYDYKQSPIARSIIFSDPVLVQSAQAGGFKLGPDNRLYYRFSVATGNIHRINTPNAAGALCNFQQNALNSPSVAGAYSFPEHAEFIPAKSLNFNPSTLPSICFGDSIATTAIASGADSIRWTSGENTNQIFLKNPGNYAFTAYYFEYCALNSGNTTLTQFPRVTANAGSDQNVQCGQTVNLMATASGGSGSNYQYKWLPNGPSNPNWTNRGAGIYNVQVTDGNTCKDTAQVRVNNIGSSFSMNFSDNKKVCNGANVSLSPSLTPATGNYRYAWSNGSTSNSISPTILRDTSFSVKVTDLATGCTDEQTVSIEVIKPILSVELSGDTAFCTGKNLIISASGADQYQWSTGSTDTFIVVNAPGTYFVNYSKGGCSSVRSDDVIINPSVQAFAGNDTLIPCGTLVNLMGSAINGSGQYTYQWVNGPAGQNYPNAGAGDYTLIVTDIIKKCSSTSGISIQNSNASFQATLAKDTSACYNQNITLRPLITPANGNYAYEWSNGSTSPSITINAIKDETLTVKITDIDFSCSLNKSSNLNTDSAFAEIELIGKNPFCDADSVLLKSKQKGLVYLWSNGLRSDSIWVKQKGVYSLSVAKNNCQNSSEPISIATVITPEPDFRTNKDSFEVGEEVFFTNRTPSYNTYKYYWSFGDNTTDDQKNPGSKTYDKAQSYLIELRVDNVTDQLTCSNTLQKSIEVVKTESSSEDDFKVVIPNAFSPNGDNINDILLLQGIGTSEIRYGVFTRWGNIVFASNSSFVQWDGRDGSGEYVEQGVYVLIYEATSNAGEKKVGTQHITVIR